MSSTDFQLFPGSSTMDPSYAAADAAFAYQQQRQHDYITPAAMGSYDMNNFNQSSTAFAMFPNSNAHSSPAGFNDEPDLQVPSSNLSTASVPSASSSQVGSPEPYHHQLAAVGGSMEWATPVVAPATGLGVSPGIVGQGDYFAVSGTEYNSYPNPQDMNVFSDYAGAAVKDPNYVDPSLIHDQIAARAMNMFAPSTFAAGSPAASPQPQILSRGGSQSPYLAGNGHSNYPFSPFPVPPQEQQQSAAVMAHGGSRDAQSQSYGASPPYSASHHQEEHYSDDGGDGARDPKQRCPHPDCGKTFKDLKAHMLTHQNERPEKCPIVNCSYHTKGFARKYDKNRHTLTHYKGTMVCGFCPGPGSAAEKSFNRADVFKRHLTAVHGVEQTPPNSRRKAGGSPGNGLSGGKKLAGGYPADATGKCSTCSQTFGNAQDFYEHLDDCVLRVVQQEDPAEAINARRLAEVENDREVHATLEKNKLPVTTQTTVDGDDLMADDMSDGEEENEEDDVKVPSSPTRKSVTTGPANGVQKSRGMTHSRGGRPLPQRNKGRKHRRDYPSSWGLDKGQMVMKKRVMAVFDGPRRLAKDDLMLSTEHEVRVPLSDGKSWVTDLDVQTMKRAVGFHSATEEEKGPWISDDPTDEERRQMELELERSTKAAAAAAQQ